METNNVPRMPWYRHLFSLCIMLRLQQIFLSLERALVICHCGFFSPLFPPSCFQSYIFHNLETHWWTRQEFSWHRSFWSRGRFPVQLSGGGVSLSSLLRVSFCESQSVYLCLCAKTTQSIRGLSTWTLSVSGDKIFHQHAKPCQLYVLSNKVK